MSRYGWSSARGRISPFRVPDDDSVPHVTDEDFAYITSQDLEDAVTSPSGLSRRDIPASDSQEPEDDVLLVKNKGITYPLHFPAYCIGDGKLVVTDLKSRLGTIMELTDSQVQNMTLLYKGKKLQLSDSPVREYGVKNRSEILSVIPESGPSVEFSDLGSRVRTKHTTKEEGVQNSPEDREAATWLGPENQVHDKREAWEVVASQQIMTDRPASLSAQYPDPSQTASTIVAAAPLEHAIDKGEVVEEEPSTIKCICNFTDDDGSTIFCETCETWQHIDCFYPDNRKEVVREDFVHLCADCKPRQLDTQRAIDRMLQLRNLTLERLSKKWTKRPPSKSHEKRSEPNATYDSDNESITSVASSLFSNTSSSTASSVGSVEHRKEVSEQLVEMLLSNGMRSVYQFAIDKLGNEFFLKIHNRILSRYLKRLKDSATDPGILLTIQTLSSRSQRSRASQLLIRMLSRNALEISNSGREKRLNERLKIASRTNRPAEDRGETSEEEVDEDEGSLKYLDLVVAFFRESPHFEKFRSELQSVTNLPDFPQTISEAVAHNDPLFIAILLDTQFRQAASGEYVWIKELKEIGYSNTDIAQLLHEKAHDSPWIYFKPEHISSSKSRPDHHLLDCAHSLKSESVRKNQASFSSPPLDKDRQVRQAVEELCGLGGILPCSRDKTEWNGTVAFNEARSMATITYSDWDVHGHNIHYSRDLFRRLIHIAERFETAARMVQDAEFCCDSFTVLKLGASSNELTTPEVQLSRIEFSLAKSFLREMETAVELGEERDHVDGDFIGENLHEILKKVTDVPPAVTAHNSEHLYSLAVQVLCVGFISYIQAHVGPIQPFFIDRPLERIVLKGCVDYIEINSGHIVAELVDLTCLGQMCKGPVLVFRKSPPGDDQASDSRDSNTKYDIRATPCDILDTWGPGELVFRSEKSSSASAIKLGGGFISSPSLDVMNSKYHWDWCLRLPQNPAPIALNGPITVGGLVNVNLECKNEEQACWSSSLGKFEELGTHRSFFEANEYQFGFQGGPDNFSLTGNKVWSKRRGRTIKTRNLEQEDYMLVPFLSFYWGVRVSYCTGVAQRVSLRQLVADLLPAFSKTYTSMGSKKSWQELLSQYHIIKTFQTSNSAQELSNWLSNLPDELYKFVLSLIRQILGTLADTGLSPDGTQFFVAWPYNGVVNRCFHIPLSSYNTWAPILADSDDCATFAYMTNTCLQSGAMMCRGPNPNWDNRLYMLETAVLCPASTGAWSLRHERTYFFHKLDNNLYWVKAQREGTQSGVPTSLVRLVSARSIPHDIRQRLIFKEERKKEKRLREKDLASVPAEVVCVRAIPN